VADEQEEKPAEGAPDAAPEAARETAVGHQVVQDEGATEVFFSREEPAAAASEPQPAAAPPPEPSGTSPAAADRETAESHDTFTDKPELFVAGAFVGAFVFAKLLKKLTGRGN
jgi:hypothetical protein